MLDDAKESCVCYLTLEMFVFLSCAISVAGAIITQPASLLF